ncbi:hypothetical protein [Nostoc sp. CCY 9925]|uniref:hypothetical protein n=1 Tax=Nostoc sp. CCY 9925 TaxID=3103865 RepID=UPI0039C6286B
MSQKRIVLDGAYVDQAEKIMKEIGVFTLSQLFTLLLVNYGGRLVTDLKNK